VATKLNQHQLNQQIELFLHQMDRDGWQPTSEQQQYLLGYEGSGGQGSNGATGEGLLYEFFTPAYVCEQMWALARHYGFPATGRVLEPSIATGRLITPAPDYSRCTGFEINPTSARIAELCHPGLKVHTGYFEQAFLQAPRYTQRVPKAGSWLEPFDLVIGNPPYGVYKNQYSSYFPEGKRVRQIDIFFTLMGLRLLKPGGLLVFITGSNFLRNGQSYQEAKAEMGKLADFVDAYRLPPVFETSKVPTDIFVLRRK
jgi:type I restriction-modification system DNA methylase subunit